VIAPIKTLDWSSSG